MLWLWFCSCVYFIQTEMIDFKTKMEKWRGRDKNCTWKFSHRTLAIAFGREMTQISIQKNLTDVEFDCCHKNILSGKNGIFARVFSLLKQRLFDLITVFHATNFGLHEISCERGLSFPQLTTSKFEEQTIRISSIQFNIFRISDGFEFLFLSSDEYLLSPFQLPPILIEWWTNIYFLNFFFVRQNDFFGRTRSCSLK